MNRVFLIGNLCADPSANTTNGGKAVSNFRIAVQREFSNAQGNRDADFFTVVAYGKTAEFVNSYLVKGRKVAIEGRVQNRSYDAQDGSKRHVTEIVATNVEALSSRQEASQTGADATADQFMEVDDPALPF